MRIEPLEARRLLSVSFDVPRKTLTVIGRDQSFNGPPDDVITVRVEHGLLRVSDNGAGFGVTASAVRTIVIDGRFGRDRITLAPSVTQRAIVYSGMGGSGGGGDDDIQTGSGNETIYLQASSGAE